MCASLASFALFAVLTNCADLVAAASSGADESDARIVAKVRTRYLCHQVSLPDDKFFLYAISDGFGGSYMVTPTNSAFAVGDVLSITGTARFSVEINTYAVFPKTATAVRHEEPEPPVPADLRQISNGEMDFRIVSVSGIVVEAFRDELDPRWNWIVIQNRGHAVPLAVRGEDVSSAELDGLVGAEVSADGLSAPPIGNRHFHGSMVRLADFRDIRVVRRESDDVFAAPQLDAVADLSHHLQRRCLDGQVLATWGDGHVFVFPGSGNAVDVKMRPSVNRPKVGDIVRVSGFVSSGILYTRLIQSVWRPLGRHVAAPKAVDIVPRKILFDDDGKLRIVPTFHGRLVRLTGVVAGGADDMSGRMLLPLDCGGYMVPADVTALDGEACGEIPQGARVSVVGVCQMEFGEDGAVAEVSRLKGFSLILRSQDDIKVLERPPWWTPTRLLMVIGALAVVLVGIMAWNVSLRAVAERRGRELLCENVAHIAAELRTDERTRLAVDLHDSLAQMLTGVSLQIDAGNMKMAARSLASCRDELRNCIWDLRNRTLEESDLGEALRRTLKPHVGTTDIAIRFHVPRSKVSDTTAHSVIMIVRELVTNAIRHGKAKSVRIAGGLDGDELKFSVRDDGCGFDPERRPGLAEGHFGLQGVRERVMRCGGTLAVESAPGRGTKVSVSLKRQG